MKGAHDGEHVFHFPRVFEPGTEQCKLIRNRRLQSLSTKVVFSHAQEAQY